MYDPDAKYEPVWAPHRYPDFDPEESGVWRVVLDDSDEPVGVVWSNLRDAAGIRWVTQTDAVTRINLHFMSGARAGTPANFAYINAEKVQGAKFGDEMSGQLSGINTLMNELIDELS